MPKRGGCLFSLFSGGKDTAKDLPYEQSESLLSQAERSFYYALLKALDVMDLRVLVCPKVGLRDVFRVVTQDNAEYTTYLNKIDRKHVDFLLIDLRGFAPVAGVELDDSSHLSERARARDAFVEDVYHTAGLPLLRFRVQHTYDIHDMVRYMREALGNKAPAPMEGERTEKPDAPIPTGPSADAAAGVAAEIHASREEIAAAAVPGVGDTPACPRCGAPMVLRKARRGRREGQYFWGCSRFPRCQGVMEMKKG